MISNMMCVQMQNGRGKLEFDVEPVQWLASGWVFWGANPGYGTITPTGLLRTIAFRRHAQIGVEETMCSFSSPIFDGKCSIITELNRIDSMSTTVEWTRDSNKTSFSCPPSEVSGFFTKPFHMTIYPKK